MSIGKQYLDDFDLTVDIITWVFSFTYSYSGFTFPNKPATWDRTI